MGEVFNPKNTRVDMNKLTKNKTQSGKNKKSVDLSKIKPMIQSCNEGAELVNDITINESEQK